MYLNSTLVLESFKRLRTNRADGKPSKTPMERTSSLMIMLAFDAAAKKRGVQMLDIDFEKTSGKIMRQDLALEYSKLVTVNNSEDNTLQSVHELGYVKMGGKDPSQRLSSNFMTTQLVAATKSENPYEYPHRPAPLLHIGKSATGVRYGIQLHPKWKEAISQHLSEVASNTPFTDLAMFCLRFYDHNKLSTLTDTLCAMLKAVYSKEVSDFWASKVRAEKTFAKHLRCEDFMEPNLIDSLSLMNNTQTRRKDLMKYDKEDLIDMIIKIEASK